MRNRNTLLRLLILLLAVTTTLALVAQTTGEKEPAKKKARKVWTNEDFPEAPAAAPEAKAEEAPEVEDPWAELDRLREERKNAQTDLDAFRKDGEELEQRRREAADDYERDMAAQAMESNEGLIADAEQRLRELDEQIAALEKFKGRQRPAPKPAPKAETPPAEEAPEEQPAEETPEEEPPS
ncbi:MAG: hypothetical protein HYY26_07285 [Acidobacteria bacterium]|nr:hypothetical protein [Acidobacteriota bacterium]